jgi:hypothetical protein
MNNRKNSIVYGLLSAGIYVILFFFMRLLNILHIYGVEMINYVVLCIICFYQTKKRSVKQGYISFLATFGISFFTGVISFFTFALFVYIYCRIDPYLNQTYLHIPRNRQELTPFIFIFFEGSAASIIVSLIVALYAEKLKGKK